MATIERFEKLEVWKTARKLTNRVYKHTQQEPFAKDFGRRDQIQRASVSVMSNIAEGFESRTQSIFVDHLGRARGSAGEVRAQLYVASDQGYLSDAEFEATYDLADKASRQLFRLIQYLESKPNASRVREKPASGRKASSTKSTWTHRSDLLRPNVPTSNVPTFQR
ncbi:four helix bundle protein [Salinibacter ruber]|nr:four helix bundle protein [Salinibacter ruber]MBB4060998.1 four helix bundle protein [Salinibacter ruber]MBB4069653.1 four helix bundle protein [Salinibacter ruber]MCS3640921.1 four helix bundle protein [Salinibacter ruber]MCS3659613.1 four helix bundle protein [Salinibacter ruber]MCS3707032.1 four helix bundle protein [Salinibacter ruber]